MWCGKCMTGWCRIVMADSKYLLRPSNHAWPHCHGAIFAAEQFPDFEREVTREGNAMHWVASEVLTSYKTPGDLKSCQAFVGVDDPAGFRVTQEIADGAQVYVSEILGVCQKHGALQALQVESSLPIPSIHPTQSGGTPDAYLYLAALNWLIVWDLKGGFRRVHAKDNPQGIQYIEGVIQKLGLDDQGLTVTFTVIQPRNFQGGGPSDSWTTPATELRPVVNWLSEQAHQIVDKGDRTLNPGQYCRDCAAVGNCPAATDAIYGFIEGAGTEYKLDYMDGKSLATERAILKHGAQVLKSRLEAIDEQIKFRIRNGDQDTGLSLEAGRSSLDWTVDTAKAIEFAKLFGIEASVPKCLTPKQTIAKAPKEMRAGFKTAMKSMTVETKGALRLVETKDTLHSRVFRK